MTTPSSKGSTGMKSGTDTTGATDLSLLSLPRAFFARPTPEVARALIGVQLWVAVGAETVAGRVVETEAYLGTDDPASHAAAGETPRSAVMFGPPGMVYVYFIYGVHHCLNLVTEPEGRAGAVLLRALEPLAGREAMARRRAAGRRTGRSSDRALRRCDLCSGPGKLCQACGIDLAWNGLCLGPDSDQRHRIWCVPGTPTRRVVATPRIGIGRAREKLLRFIDPDSGCLTRSLTSTRGDTSVPS